jgi:aspartate aminotransferase-like enzyme
MMTTFSNKDFDFAQSKWMFIPGPVNVHPDVLRAMGTPPINHRGKEFAQLHDRLQQKAQWLMQTKNAVYFSTSSAIGLMEACSRNLVSKRALHLTCGSFSEQWHMITRECGKESDANAVEWGKANRPDELKKSLDTGKYDTVCVVFSETSTAVMNPLPEIASIIKQYPDVVFCLDTVSALAATPVMVDDWGVDVCFASVQKGLALPPGFTVFSISQKALARARTVPHRGFYFDFLVFEDFGKKSQTPTTPSLPHMFGLDKQFDRIKAEGLENRWKRHRQLATRTQEWAEAGWACFAEKGHRSDATTAVVNTHKIDFATLDKHLLNTLNVVISAGYGKLKDATFRIGHVGETTLDQLNTCLAEIDRFAQSR